MRFSPTAEIFTGAWDVRPPPIFLPMFEIFADGWDSRWLPRFSPILGDFRSPPKLLLTAKISAVGRDFRQWPVNSRDFRRWPRFSPIAEIFVLVQNYMKVLRYESTRNCRSLDSQWSQRLLWSQRFRCRVLLIFWWYFSCRWQIV